MFGIKTPPSNTALSKISLNLFKCFFLSYLKEEMKYYVKSITLVPLEIRLG